MQTRHAPRVLAAGLLAGAAALAGPAVAQTTAPGPATATPAAAARGADTLLVNGKIVTVDDRFSVVPALAITGERVVAAGSLADIEALKTPQTRVIDLAGKTVVPGLIDNHAHFMRAAEYWDREVRLDGITSRQEALAMIAAKAKASKPGELVLSLGGWSEEQFTDQPGGFTKAELDAAAPDNPVVLQVIYFRIYANSAALKALGVTAETPDPRNGRIEKDTSGQPTGVFNGGGAVAWTLGRLGEVARERGVANARALMRDLNRMGITAYQEMGGRGFNAGHIETFRTVWERKQMTVRAFYNLWQEPTSAEGVDKALAVIAGLKPFQGDDWLDHTGYGETVYFPLHDNLLARGASPTPEAMAQWRRIAQAIADKGMHLNVHAQLRGTIEAFLTEIETINGVKPIKGLRWTMSHADQIEPQDIARMKRLGMYVQLHSRPTIQGALMLKTHGDRAYAMPPLRLVQDSGIPWGLGSDATAVTPTNPFTTLHWAVTGEMVGGRKVLKETITREEALIAHTRSNAAFLFQEANLGSLAPGKYADLVVLDRDYLTVPAAEIKDITSVMTMVGGKVVHEAK
ncbi:amidohydrolase [Rhodoplanes sp. TEM]|uniref:amidohydrolase n=1 Tax=Rhodoplanes TaxID=29407 RepID=UPI0023505D16|nr:MULTISPECIES: amidohydrolase [Rhodoplanes]MDC7982689.1 amidohydrolase [Rhodoplanes sp. TEM]MDQ0357664.1 putative amidohydrolase YtcJ [Rhodoplanes tepidamans]